MTDKTDTVARAAGRPPIDDTVDVYLHVESGLRRRPQSIRSFTGNRANAYVGPNDPNAPRRSHPIKGEALRRRFTGARRDMFLTPENHEGMTRGGIVLHGERALDGTLPEDGCSPVITMVEAIVDRMLEDRMLAHRI